MLLDLKRPNKLNTKKMTSVFSKIVSLSLVLPVVAALVHYYKYSHLSVPVLIFRSVVGAVVYRNKMTGVRVMTVKDMKANKVGEGLLVGSIIRPSWLGLDVEAQTIASLVAWSGGKTQTQLDRYGLRKAMDHQILFPPISSYNSDKLEVIEELRGSLYITLKNRNTDKKKPKILFNVHGGK